MGNRAMPLPIRSCGHWTRRHASAILLSTAGLAGIAGCAFNVSPGERLAATAHEETESKTPVKTSALSRLLKRQPKEATAPETETATSSTSVRGRLFSSLVDRFPSRKRDDVDPFLEAEIEAERERTKAGAEPRIADNKTEEKARTPNSVVLAPKTQRSDAELWKIFSEDSAAANKTAAVDPTLEAGNPAAPPITRQAIAHNNRDNPFESTEPEAAPRTRTASNSVASAPIVSIEHEDVNPFARFVNEPAGAEVAHEPAAATPGSASAEVQSLITQARQQEQRGQLQQAHQSAVEAAAIANRDHIDLSGDVERPEQLARRLEQRLKAATRDPFSDSFASDAATKAATSPFTNRAAPSGSIASGTQAQPAATPAGSESAPAAPTASSLGSVFPKAPEWRGVRANSPVSLAVVEQTDPAVSANRPPIVRHADLTDTANTVRGTGRLLPRTLQSREPAETLSNQPLAFANQVAAEGPLLAPPRAVPPVAAAPQLPAVAEATVAAVAVPAVADETLDSSRNYGGWVVGGLLLVAGLWLLGVRGANPFSRQSAARR